MAPLTGIAFAINWLINKLNLNALLVKTTRMTTNSCGLHKSGLSEPHLLLLFTAPCIKLRFIKAEFAGSSSDTNTLSQF